MTEVKLSYDAHVSDYYADPPSLSIVESEDTHAAGWDWPPTTTDVESLCVSAGLISTLLRKSDRDAVSNIMSRGTAPIDPDILNKIYSKGREFRILAPRRLNPKEAALFTQLRDSMTDWFFDFDWTRQPESEQGAGNGNPDLRFHRLLLPAHMLNVLSKLVTARDIEDVNVAKLVALSEKAKRQLPRYLSNRSFGIARFQVNDLKARANGSGRNGFGEDLKDWIVNDESTRRLAIQAHEILGVSYRRNMEYLHESNTAAGLYFMKSVVVGAMIDWHQERLGITEYIPPIRWHFAKPEDNYSYYNFQTNVRNGWGDMHTHNARFPFQRYVAHYMRDKAELDRSED